MAGPDKIGASGIAVGERPDRRGAVFGGNPGGGAMAVIDRNGKGGAIGRIAVGYIGAKLRRQAVSGDRAHTMPQV
jgi:hypothetical protein